MPDPTDPPAAHWRVGQSTPPCCPIVELRQYTLHPGKRDVLIDLFERAFIESQESVGMQVIGQFRDLDHPNRFVWLRGFRDMPTRAQALQAFYGGPVWAAHRDAANSTMIDSDNVLLLRPARPTSGFAIQPGHRPSLGTKNAGKGLVVVTIYFFDRSVPSDFVGFFEDTVTPIVTENGAAIVASFVTDSSVNTFPALPVREHEHVFVWFARFHDQGAYEQHIATLSRAQRWQKEVSDELARHLTGQPEVLRLSPTPRSQLHG